MYFRDWYADTLVGARFIGHPMAPQFQATRVVVDDPEEAITRGLGPEWTMTDEWYSFAASPRATGAHVLATLHESSYSPIGHPPESYTEPHAAVPLDRGIAWAAGLGETRCAAGRERPRTAGARP